MFFCRICPMEYILSRRFSIKQIFQEHWDSFLSKHKDSIPDYVVSAVNKMLSCRDPNKLGYHKYSCPAHPEEFIVVPHSCKGRFCNSCGKILTDKWVNKINSDFPPTPFHHMCFTIPDSLRELFNKYRFLLNCLFIAASQTVLSYYKQRYLLPAVVCCIHTFGRNLKINPHIHMLITAGGILLKNGRLNKWKSIPYIPFRMLHKRYRFLLIDTLKKTITKYLKDNPDSGELSVFSHPGLLDAFFNPLLKINWYVYDSKELPHEDFTVSYIVRYTKRPPLAECRILDYGRILDSGHYGVTFSYKERNYSPIKWTVPVEKFIGLLIQHIPPKHFRQVRYYGALANRTKPSLKNVLSKLFERMEEMNKLATWRERYTAFTGKDPFLCPVCNREMQLVEVAYFSRSEEGLRFYFPP